MGNTTIPRLNRAEPSSGLPKNDRINMNVQSQGQQIMQTTNAIAGVAEAGMDIYQKAENQKIETLGNLAEQEFTAWNNEQLAKLKNIQGDPTDAYKAYDDSVKKKREEMLSARPDLNERVKNYYQTKIDRTIASQNVVALKQRGAQQETFDNNVFENTIKLKKESMTAVAGDPELFDMNIRDIKDAIVKRGLKQGTVKILDEKAEIPKDGGTLRYHTYQDADGKVVRAELSDLAVQRFVKERAEGIKSSIEVLTASGRVAEAKEMREKYGDALDSLSKTKVDTKLTKVGRKEEAAEFLAENDGLDAEEFEKAVDDLSTDPLLQAEVLKLKAGKEKSLDQLRTLSEKRNYDYLMKDLMERQKSERPFASIAELENDKKFALVFDRLNAKQQKAVIEMVESPKESDPKAIARMQENFFTGKIYDMDPADFQAELVGMDKAEKAKWNTRYFNAKSDTAGEKRATYGIANKLLTDGLVEAGFIERDDRNKITGEDADILYRARANMIEVMDHLGPQSPEQLQQLVKKFTAKEIKDKAFKSPQVSVDAVKKKKTGPKTLTEQQLRDMKVKFRNKYSRFPRPDDQKLFDAFVQANS